MPGGGGQRSPLRRQLLSPARSPGLGARGCHQPALAAGSGQGSGQLPALPDEDPAINARLELRGLLQKFGRPLRLVPGGFRAGDPKRHRHLNRQKERKQQLSRALPAAAGQSPRGVCRNGLQVCMEQFAAGICMAPSCRQSRCGPRRVPGIVPCCCVAGGSRRSPAPRKNLHRGSSLRFPVLAWSRWWKGATRGGGKGRGGAHVCPVNPSVARSQEAEGSILGARDSQPPGGGGTRRGTLCVCVARQPRSPSAPTDEDKPHRGTGTPGAAWGRWHRGGSGAGPTQGIFTRLPGWVSAFWTAQRESCRNLAEGWPWGKLAPRCAGGSGPRPRCQARCDL